MDTISSYFLIFLIYSVIGWCVETLAKSIQYHHFVDRGFLIGPYCPIYGVGALLASLLLRRYSHDPLTVFILAMVIAGVLEYFTSLIMEKIFHARWWDYSKKPFNIEGRVCLRNLLYFGIMAMLAIYLVDPILLDFINNLGSARITIALVLFAIMLFDFVISTTVLARIRKEAHPLDQDNTEEVAAQVRRAIQSLGWKHRRILSAFPNTQPLPKKK